MQLRSLLFVPADRPERFAKAAASGADAIILDLEDSVSPERKPFARTAVSNWLAAAQNCHCFVRVNPQGSGETERDLDALRAKPPTGIVLPKAEGAASVAWLAAAWGGDAMPPVLPIATETPAAIFELGSFRSCAGQLAGISWGAEDLPAAIGAKTSRNADGSYTAPYEIARTLTLFAAHAAGVAAIDTVFPAISDNDGLAAYAIRAARDGFTAMLAIHPSQIAAINAAFSPSAEDVAAARRIVDAFADAPGAGALQIDGKMIDAPHLKQARHILALAGQHDQVQRPHANPSRPIWPIVRNSA